MSWASRRRLIYGSIMSVMLLIVVGVPLFFILHEPPSCSDGRRNGTETGVDCGGVCMRICADEVAPLVLKWSRSFEVSPGLYSAVAYIENPNNTAGIPLIKYRFELFDAENLLITTREGETYIAPNGTSPIFEANISTGERIPARTFFEFISLPDWRRAEDVRPLLSISRRTLSQTETKPRLSAILTNTSPVREIADIDAVAVVLGSDGNAIAASRTVVPRITPQESTDLIFTWPLAFPKRPEQCAAPVDVALLLDTSGSMNDLGDNPPQPLTDAKEAAAAFVSRLLPDDRVGVIEFASDASILSPPSRSHDAVIDQIGTVSVLPREEAGSTNMGDGLLLAREMLSPARVTDEGVRVPRTAVLLTDGRANAPEDPGGEAFARTQADRVKAAGITLYTIGLGDAVSGEFLTELAGAPSNYYQALSSGDLEHIYETISEAICERGAAVIDINLRTRDVFERR